MAIDFLETIIKFILIGIVIFVVIKLLTEWLIQGRDLIIDAKKNGYSIIFYKILGLIFFIFSIGLIFYSLKDLYR